MGFLILVNFLIIFVSYVNTQGCVVSITTVSGPTAKTGTICSGDVVFEDDFDGDSLNLNLWSHEETMAGGGNNESQLYTNNPDNAYTADGVLHIRPTFTEENYDLYSDTIDLRSKCTAAYNDGCLRQGTPQFILPPITSARLNSKVSFTYGRMEVRAKNPSGDWLWPAIWLMPTNSEYGYAGKSGELDVMEGRGNEDLRTEDKQNLLGVQQFASTLHFGVPENLVSLSKYKDLKEGFDKAYHVYGLYWSPEKIEFLLDGNVFKSIDVPKDGFLSYEKIPEDLKEEYRKKGKINAPFDKDFYIILNTAVAGNAYFSDSWVNKNGKKPWSNNEERAALTSFWKGKEQWKPTWDNSRDGKSEFLIDYVKVYAL